MSIFKYNLTVVPFIMQHMIAGLMVSLFSTSIFANPVLDRVTSGNVSIQQTNSTTTVNQMSSKAIIEWNQFNIGANEHTHFQQPNGGSTLNRINPDSGVSQIFGKLTATGQIILVNPAGIFFGPGSYVNVGGIVASTVDIKNDDFLNNYYHFSNSSNYNGAVINQGMIVAADHGLVALIGGAVSNSGDIVANVGHVVLASGEAFTMSFAGNDLVGFSVDKGVYRRAKDQNGNEMKDGASNTGSISANGGQVIISAKDATGVLDHVINMQGYTEIKSVYVKNGSLIISGDKHRGKVKVAGRINASGRNAGERGGNITITGHNILLTADAFLDVRGDKQGGNVNVGGNYKGLGVLPHANAVVMTKGATINADATTNGNGGSVVLWSDYYTNANGSISARGGAISGNGGLIETSSKNVLNIHDLKVDTTAPHGSAGLWLLDPYDITIVSSGADTGGAFNNENPNIFTPTGSATILNSTLNSNLENANVTIITNNTGGSDAGDINVNADISWASNFSLTLSAYHDINIAGNTTISNTGSGNVSLIADNLGTSCLVSTCGTVTFGVNSFVNLAAGTVKIYYNPATFGVPTLSFYTGGTTPTSYQLVNALGNQNDGTSLRTLGAITRNSSLWSQNFALARDIDASASGSWNSGRGMTPIGNDSTSFSGKFDGLNHSISNLYAYQSSGTVQNMGFFGVLSSAASISNLNLQVDYTQYFRGVSVTNIGGLAGQNLGGSIANVMVSGSVRNYENNMYKNVGGLIGYNTGQIVASHSTADVAVANGSGVFNNVGGLVGTNDSANGFNGSITDSSYSGITSSSYNSQVYCGNGCSASGGLVGLNRSIINSSYSTGMLLSNFSNNTGGLVGVNASNQIDGSINSSYSSMNVTAQNSVTNSGGLVGLNTAHINNSYSISTVTGDVNVGGLVGSNETDSIAGTISNSYSTGSVTGNTKVGGLVGNFDSGTVNASFWDTDTSGQLTSDAGIGQSTGDLQNITTFTDVGWSITNTPDTIANLQAYDWLMVPGTRPMLSIEHSTEISNTHQLQLISLALNENYRLTRNLDLSSITTNAADVWGTGLVNNVQSGFGFVPIGDDSANLFTGHFNGLNFTISNLAINQPTGNNNALFAASSSASIIENVIFTSPVIQGFNNQNVATVVGQSGGILRNITINGGSVITTGVNSHLGGIVGQSSHELTNLLVNNMSISGVANVGGIAGSVSGGTINNIINNSTVTGTSKVGGLIGLATNVLIQNSRNNAVITGANMTGGLIGSANNATLNSSTNNGSVNGGTVTGGLIGSALSSTIQSASNLANITALSLAGGLVGSATNSTLNASMNAGIIDANATVGGLIGYADNSDIYSSLNTALIRATNGSKIGGLAGQLTNNSSMTVSYNIGTLSANGGNQLGGLAGNLDSTSSISSSYYSGEITAAGSTQTGAIVGRNEGGSVAGTYYDTETTGQLFGIGADSVASYNPTNNGTQALTTANSILLTSYSAWNIADQTDNLTNSTPPSAEWFIFDNMTRPLLMSEWSLVVTTPHQLQLMATALQANYTLAANIQLDTALDNSSDIWATRSSAATGAGFIPIGNAITGAFTGSLNGQGYVIDQLYLRSTANSEVGLFGSINNASIEKLGVTNANIIQTISGNVGGILTGYAMGASNISEVYTSGSITSTSYTGGLVGQLDDNSAIINAYNIASVTSTDESAGGIAGAMLNGNPTITNTYNSGMVTAGNDVGGITGRYDVGNIDESYWDQDILTGSTNGTGDGFDTSSMMSSGIFSNWDISSDATNTAGMKWFIFEDSTRPILMMENVLSISNAHQLQMMAVNLTGHYTLENDINLGQPLNNASDIWGANSKGFYPIGNEDTDDSYFSGSLNGAHHIIDNLSINNGDIYIIGLFGATNGSALVKNLGFTNVDIIGANVNSIAGALAGYNYGTIINVFSTGNITSTPSNQYSALGGLVGINEENSKILSSYSTVNVSLLGTRNGQIGGLVGDNNGSIHSSYATGNVTTEVNAAYVSAGGLVGSSAYNSSINNSYSSGVVKGAGYIGGLVGSLNSGTIENSFSSSIVTGYYSTNMNLGFNSSAVGGLVGAVSANDGTIAIRNSYSTGSVTGIQNIGGLVGKIEGGTISASYSTATVNMGFGNDSASYVRGIGGLVGTINNNSTIENSYSSGAMTLKKMRTESYPNNTLGVGGLVGIVIDGHIQNAYSLSPITVTESSEVKIGSLVGELINGDITNSYGAGKIYTFDVPYQIVGGLVGSSTGTITNSFWDTQSTTINSSAGGSPMTTAQMMSFENFTNTGNGFVTSGWDMTDTPSVNANAPGQTWFIFDGGTRPFLMMEHSNTIANSHQLQLIGVAPSANYTVINDINFIQDASTTAGSGFLPIGNSATPFSGSFNGQNYTINNLFINRPTSDYVGLFGYNAGSVTNVVLTNVNITGKNVVGGIAGYNTGIIHDVAVNGGTISGSLSTSPTNSLGTSTYVGGLIGYNQYSGAMPNLSNTANVTGAIRVGGLMGYSAGGTINHAYNTGNITGPGGAKYLGGLVGDATQISLDQAYNLGNVSVSAVDSTTNFIGGLFGQFANGTLSNAYNIGSVNTQSSLAIAGGLIGNMTSGTVNNSYSSGLVSVHGNVAGGFIGRMQGTVTNSFWDTDSSQQSTAGGITYGNYAGVAGGCINGICSNGGSVNLSLAATYAGWDISSNTTASTTPDTTWFIFNGQTRPLMMMEYSTTISNPHQLQLAGSNIYANYTLANDIDLTSAFTNTADIWGTNITLNTGKGFVPLAYQSSGFNGDFDGRDFIINALYIHTSGSEVNGLGLFAGVNGDVSHLGLTNVDLRLTAGSVNVGALTANLNGTLNQVYAQGMISASNVVQNISMGGLVGSVNAGSVSNAHSDIAVTSLNQAINSNNNVGGFVGFNQATIMNSFSLGSVTGVDHVGGFAGESSGQLTAVYSSGQVIGHDNVGGLVGKLSGQISDAYSISEVSGNTNVGGLVGYSSGQINNTYSSGMVSGLSNVGGFLGLNAAGGAITGSFWDIGSSGQSAGYGVDQTDTGGGTGMLDNGSTLYGGCFGNTSCQLSAISQASNANGAPLDLADINTYLLDVPAWNLTDTPSTTSAAPNFTWFMFSGARPVLMMENSATISSAHQLQMMAVALQGNYTLINDIDLSGPLSNPADIWGGSNSGFFVIGDRTTPFTGLFDGQDHVINHLMINRTDQDVGLFGALKLNSVVKNIHLTNVAVTLNVTGSTKYFVGGLVGTTLVDYPYNIIPTITNTSTSGAVTGVGVDDKASAGGLIGALYAANLSYSHSSATVSGNSQVGGLIGLISGGDVSKSHATGNVFNTASATAPGSYTFSTSAGGLIGAGSGELLDVYSTGNVAFTIFSPNNIYRYAGSLAGVAPGGLSITRAYSTGSVNVNATNGHEGGIAGLTNDSNYSNTFYDMASTGISKDFGNNNANNFGKTTAEMMSLATYAGWNITSDPTNAMSSTWFIFDGTDGNTNGNTRPMLMSEYSTTVTNAHQLQLMGAVPNAVYTISSNIDLSGPLSNPNDVWGGSNVVGIPGSGFVPIGNAVLPFTGTLVGQNNTIDGLNITSSVSAVGLFGVVDASANVNNINLTNVTITSPSGTNIHTGALAGVNAGTINNVSANGNLVSAINSGAGSLGGLVGFNTGILTDISFTNGSITGVDNVGGLVGNNAGTLTASSAGLSYLINTTVSGNNIVGGIIGTNAGNVSNTNFTGNVFGVGMIGASIAFSDVGSNYSSTTIGDVTLNGLPGNNHFTLNVNDINGLVQIYGATTGYDTPGNLSLIDSYELTHGLNGLTNPLDLAEFPVVDFTGYQQLIKVTMSTVNNGGVTMNGNAIVNYENINALVGNGGFGNQIIPVSDKLGYLVISSATSGYFSDPILYYNFIMQLPPSSSQGSASVSNFQSVGVDVNPANIIVGIYDALVNKWNFDESQVVSFTAGYDINNRTSRNVLLDGTRLDINKASCALTERKGLIGNHLKNNCNIFQIVPKYGFTMR